MKNLIFGLILLLAGGTFCRPENAFGQHDKSSAQIKPPKVVRYSKPTRTKNKRKKTMHRKVDLSKVPRVVRPAN
jgi:hypothetical protein